MTETITLNEIAQSIDKLAAMVAEQFLRIEHRLDRIEERLDGLELRMDRLEERMDRLEARMDSLELRMDKLEHYSTTFEARTIERFNLLDKKIDMRITTTEDRLIALKTTIEQDLNTKVSW